MSYKFTLGRQYLMPTHFGPMSGPRHTPDGKRFSDPDDRTKETYTVRFLSTEDALNAILPDGFVLEGEPFVSVTFSYISNIAWLAGRGYNMLGVSVPARLKARDRDVVGPFLLVLWENLADPIITGREQLGFNKIYCELPEPSTSGGNTTLRAAWLGHQFAVMRVRDLKPQPTAVGQPHDPSCERASLLHLRYFPTVGDGAEAVVCEPVISPLKSATGKVEALLRGEGDIDFLETRWEDMPTQFHVVEGIRRLPMLANRGAEYCRFKGGGDNYFQEAIEAAA